MMYDTIAIRLPIISIPKDKLKKGLSNVTFTNIGYIKDSVLNYRKGNYRNLSVIIFNNILKIEGSLPKLLLNNNVDILTKDQVIEALFLIKKAFPGIPILSGYLSRVDVAECFIVDSKIQGYFRAMKDTPEFSRSIDWYGVRYTKGKRQFAFYDKTDDAMKVPKFISQLTQEGATKSMLRIELRYKSTIRRLLMNDIKKLTPIHLISNKLQNILAKAWATHYDNVIKKRITLQEPKMTGWADVKKYLAMLTLHSDNLNDWILNLNDIAKNNNWDAGMKSDVKRKSIDLYNDVILSSKINFIEELDGKIERSEIITSFLNEDERFRRKNQRLKFEVLKA